MNLLSLEQGFLLFRCEDDVLWDQNVFCDVDEQICLLEGFKMIAVADFADDLSCRRCDLILVHNNATSNALLQHNLAVLLDCLDADRNFVREEDQQLIRRVVLLLNQEGHFGPTNTTMRGSTKRQNEDRQYSVNESTSSLLCATNAIPDPFSCPEQNAFVYFAVIDPSILSFLTVDSLSLMSILHPLLFVPLSSLLPHLLDFSIRCKLIPERF